MSSKCKQKMRRRWPSTPWGWPASTYFLRLLWTRLEMRGRFRSRHGRKILKTDDGLENPKHCHQHDHSSNRTAVDSLVYLIGLTIVEWNNLEIRIIVLTQGNCIWGNFPNKNSFLGFIQIEQLYDHWPTINHYWERICNNIMDGWLLK